MPFAAHAWVREGGNATDIPVDISVLNNLRQFVRYSRLKQFALRVSQTRIEIYFWGKCLLCSVSPFWQALASTLDEAEISDLRDQFDAIDVDKNGVISLEEMRQVSELYDKIAFENKY